MPLPAARCRTGSGHPAAIHSSSTDCRHRGARGPSKTRPGTRSRAYRNHRGEHARSPQTSDAVNSRSIAAPPSSSPIASKQRPNRTPHPDTAATNDGAMHTPSISSHQNDTRNRMNPTPRDCGDDCCLRTISYGAQQQSSPQQNKMPADDCENKHQQTSANIFFRLSLPPFFGRFRPGFFGRHLSRFLA
jgi:hypothetical protein